VRDLRCIIQEDTVKTRHSNCSLTFRGERTSMMVAGGLGILVVLCLLLSMVEKPPAVGR
jgi:hypothetical protein